MLIIYFAFNEFLFYYQGTEAVQALDIWEAKDSSIYHEEKEARWLGFTSSKRQKVSLWNPNAFFKMPKLKFLRIRSICPQFVPEYLPNDLTYLEWSNYPSKLLPCFLPNELVQLHLQLSKIELLWGGMKVRVLINILIQICFKTSITNTRKLIILNFFFFFI